MSTSFSTQAVAAVSLFETQQAIYRTLAGMPMPKSPENTNSFAVLATLPVADASKEIHLLDMVEEMTAEVESWKAKHGVLRAILQTWKNEYAELENSNTAIRSSYDALAAHWEGLSSDNDRLAEENSGLYTVVDEVRVERHAMELRIQELERTNQELRCEKDQATTTIVGLQHQNAELNYDNERQKALLEANQHVADYLKRGKANLETRFENACQRNDGLLEENIRLATTVTEQQTNIEWYESIVANTLDVQDCLEREKEKLVEDAAVLEMRLGCLAAKKVMRYEELKDSNRLVEKLQTEQMGFKILIKTLQGERDRLEKRFLNREGLVAFMSKQMQEFRKANPELAKLLSSPPAFKAAGLARLRANNDETEDVAVASTGASDSTMVNKWLSNIA